MEEELFGISIVILNHNTYSLTCACIQSIYQTAFNKDAVEIILVDNGSSENQPIPFTQVFPEIIYIRSEINVGFAKGNNIGIRKATKQYILLLNSDTILTDPDTLSKCIKKLNEFEDKVILTTRLLTESGNPQPAYNFLPNLKYELLFTSFLYKLLTKQKKEDMLIRFVPNVDRVIESGYITATFCLFSKKLISKFAEQKLYDNIFLYGEELFWASQYIKAGYKMFYFADVSIIHFSGQSSIKEKNYVRIKRAYQTEGELKYLTWKYSRITVFFIYSLRIVRFIILSPFDFDIRIRLTELIKLLMHRKH